MLQKLEIRNYILIDELSIEFNDGLSIITGETGSGKSILLGAINQLLGNRIDHKIVGPKKDKCTIEAIFNISDYNLKNFFIHNDLDYSTDTIIRREILRNGKSRAFINDSPVKIEILKKISSYLIDIHSQNQNDILSYKSFFYNFIDFFANQEKKVFEFKKMFNQLNQKKIDYNILKEKKQNIIKDYDYNLFLLNEIKTLNLASNEKEKLQNEYNSLKNYEKIQSSFDELNILIGGQNNNLIERLTSILNILKKISDFSSQFKDIDSRFEKVFIETTDIIESISSHSEQLTFDSEKFDTIQSRLFKIQELENKHNVNSISQLIEVKNKLNDKVESTDYIDSEIDKLNLEILNIEKDLTKEANQIYSNRLKTADGLQNEIEKIFSLLSLKGCLIRFEFIKEEKLNSFGIDNLNVLYSPGKTIELKPLAKIASGGEKSRILLAIKSVFAKKNSLPTIIFDEIDSGTSGEIAESIGFLMKEMSNKIQILSITHLAQVASKGDYHFKVVKASDNGKSTTSIVELSDKERVSEIASMISGKKITNSALNQAEELLK